MRTAANLPNVNIDISKLDSEDTLLQDIETMNSFGERTTGSSGHKEYIAWLQEEIKKLGYEIHRNRYNFMRWQARHFSLTVEDMEINVAGVYPYSGETSASGIDGELIYIKPGNYRKAEGKIAVIDICHFERFPYFLIFNILDKINYDGGIPSGEGLVTLTSTLKSGKLKKAKKTGVKGVIIIWHNISPELLKDQYAPFVTDYAGVPALILDEREGMKVIEAAKRNARARLVLEADIVENEETESFHVIVRGKSETESIIINSHTDGVNCIEENGCNGMLSMLRYLAGRNKPARNMIFVFITGHFRLPIFRGTSQAASTWMKDNPDMWDGQKGHLKAVAGLTVEHLGALEWKVTDGIYQSTGRSCLEYTYCGNEYMQHIWKYVNKDRDDVRGIICRGINRMNFGESQPLFEENIPVIGFIPVPDYLLVNSSSRELEKFSVKLMLSQLKSLLNALLIIDATDSKYLGRGMGYSYGIGKVR